MSFVSKRKQDNLASHEVRNYKLRVMLNNEELSILDGVRGKHSRAEAMRFLMLNELPAPIPELNASAWSELARASANLNQLAHRANAGETLQIDEVRRELESFRARLIGV